LFGIGHNRFADEIGLAAHNSFVHAFAELGILGGMMFLGIFALVGWSNWKLLAVRKEITQPSLRHLSPYILGLIVAVCVSMLSLSRNYVVPPYLYAGLAVSYFALAHTDTSIRLVRFNPRVCGALAAVSASYLGIIYFYIILVHRIS
jgi:hypothetical protein